MPIKIIIHLKNDSTFTVSNVLKWGVGHNFLRLDLQDKTIRILPMSDIAYFDVCEADN